MLSYDTVQSSQLCFGISVIKDFVDARVANSIITTALDDGHWAPSASGIYESNQLIGTEYLTKTGVLSIPRLEFSVWQHHSSFYRLNEFVWSEWSLPISRFSNAGIARYPEGAFVDEHQDTGPLNTSRIVTFVLYLNDKFMGGEIFFPQLSVKYKPHLGDLLVFLSEYRHRVEPIRNGERFCLVWFGEGDI